MWICSHAEPNIYMLLKSKLNPDSIFICHPNVDHFHAGGQPVYHLISLSLSLPQWGMVAKLKSESSQADLNQGRR